MRATTIDRRSKRFAPTVYIAYIYRSHVIDAQNTCDPITNDRRSILRIVGVKTKMALYVSDTWGAYVITTWRLIADVTKTGNREWVMSTGNGKMKIRTRKRIVMGNEFTDRARVQVLFPFFFFPFHWSFPVPRSLFYRHSKK